jgi:HSP20 family protein
MQLTRCTPGHRFENRHNLFPGLMDEFFAPFAGNSSAQASSFVPSVDVYEKDDTIFFEAELPGFKKDNISVDVKGKVVTLGGERSEGKSEGENRLRKERKYGKFERSFQHGFEADSDSIKASYENGILTVQISKPQEQKVKQIEIN